MLFPLPYEALEAQSSLPGAPAQNVVPPGAIIPNAIIHRRTRRNYLDAFPQPLPLGFILSTDDLFGISTGLDTALDASARQIGGELPHCAGTREDSVISCTRRAALSCFISKLLFELCISPTYRASTPLPLLFG